MNRQKHVLFVAFHYPPEASSSGVLRTLKYSRYLQECGWRVTVLTPEISAFEVIDPALEAQVPSAVRVVRTRFVNIKRDLAFHGVYPALLALPDRWIGWWPWAVSAGKKILEADPIDAIYSTSPHATAHLIAWRLANLSRKPWVTDFRDPWFEDTPEPGDTSGPVFHRLNRALEGRVIRRCNRVVTSTTHLRDLLRARYATEESKIYAILNGFDESDFSSLPQSIPCGNKRLRIIHAGNINAEFRDPRPLLTALGNLIREGHLAAAECEIDFIGGGAYGESAEVRAAICSSGLAGSVSFLPRVPYEESLRRLAGADLLLLLQASDDTVGLVPAKLYEYLRTQKPTLALVRTGAVTEIMERTGGGWCIDPDNGPALAKVLAEVVRAWREGQLESHRADLEVLRCFDRRALTAELAGVLQSACAQDIGNPLV